jgi:hypothetical protein
MQKQFDVSLAVFENLDFVSRNEAPQPHEAVYSGVHRKKILINNWDRKLSNMSAGSSSEEHVAVPLTTLPCWKVPLKNRKLHVPPTMFTESPNAGCPV